MRIWDVPQSKLCRNHLLGEHRELHAIWSVLTRHKKGYSHHPETLRWKGKLRALYRKHDEIVSEMIKRGYQHRSPLNHKLALGQARQSDFVNSIREQIKILRGKRCQCDL